MMYTLFFPYCLLHLPCSLLPAPCSLKKQSFYLTNRLIAID
ncbi:MULTISPECIES: hypothetical protein [unclassified Moorena]|nr:MULTISPECIES: hypothetical protein [unclassified Moorena]